jgi:hypothetical protein
VVRVLGYRCKDLGSISGASDFLRSGGSGTGHVERMGEKRTACSLLVGKPEGKKPLGRPRRRWVDNIRMDLGEVGWGDVHWIGLAQDMDRELFFMRQ